VSTCVEAIREQPFVACRALRPSPALAEYVRGYQYWDSFTVQPSLQPFAVSVFPLVTFHLRERGNAFEYATKRTRVLPRCIMVGPCDYRVADVVDVGHMVRFTVVFHPTGLFRLLRISPWDVRNCAYDCEEVLGARISELHARLTETSGPEQMVAAVEHVLLAACRTALPRSEMHSAAATLLSSHGGAHLFAVMDSLGVSDSSWRRHFIDEIGVTPKRYSRMLRFRHALALKRAFVDRPWTQICLDAGYYDQAHFIADCRALVGCSPSRFMRELAAVPEAITAAWYGPEVDPSNRTAFTARGGALDRERSRSEARS
jgi:AraC-like DNA-binding protein